MTKYYVVFTLICVDLISFVTRQSQPALECSCDGISKGCDFVALHSYPIDQTNKKENVALGKKSTLSSVYLAPAYKLTGGDASRFACLGLNGDTSSFDLNNTQSTNFNCFQTSNELEPKWVIDLGRNYLIREIIIYARSGYTHHMSEVIVSVNNEVCYTFPVRNTFPVQNVIQCNKPIVGNSIIVSKPPLKAWKEGYYISMCELQVWVCREGYFGINCTDKCNCLGGECRLKEQCTSGCQAGWQGEKCEKLCSEGTYGLNCSKDCNNCKDNKCNPDDGICHTDCKDTLGYQCKEPSKIEGEEKQNVPEVVIGTFVGIVVASVLCLALYLVLKKKSEDYDDETLPHPIQKMSRVEQSISPINERRQSLQQVENVSVSEEMRENTEEYKIRNSPVEIEVLDENIYQNQPTKSLAEVHSTKAGTRPRHFSLEQQPPNLNLAVPKFRKGKEKRSQDIPDLEEQGIEDISDLDGQDSYTQSGVSGVED